jgi:succinyl-diaminopimelate desuccinylase
VPFHDKTLDLAKQLIACRSLTPDDGGALDLIRARLTGADFVCEQIDRPPVKNLWARHGNGSPVVCLAGHVDVVPPGPVDRWTSDPFTPTERDGALFGRGAADMKTSVAALVTAAERFVAREPRHRGTVALLFTSDEEGAGVDGTAAVVRELQARRDSIDACLIGEPTSVSRFGDTIKNGRRGSLNGVLRVNGVQCHIAYPSAAVIRSRARFRRWRSWRPSNGTAATSTSRRPVFKSPTSMPVPAPTTSSLARSTSCSTSASPPNRRGPLKARVHAVLDAQRLDYELKWSLSGAPFLSPRGGLVDVVSAAVAAVTGVDAGAVDDRRNVGWTIPRQRLA